MSYKRTTVDALGKENSIITVNKLSKPNIKDKISLWERKDLSGPNSASSSVARKSSLTKSFNKEKDNFDGQNTTEKHEVDVALLKDSSEDKAKNNCCKTKNEVETYEDIAMKTPVMVEKLQFGSLKLNKDSTSQERKDVFSLFRKLEAMDDGRTTAELGNYFSPPSKAPQDEERRKKAGQTISPAESINPVPKPRRTFQHPSHSGTLPRGPRHLPPLPSHKTCVPHCPGQVQGEKAESAPRKSLEPEHTRSLFPRARPQEHHYEDILDKENPYEDIELESSCSQQSLASSPGADTNKTLRAGFFRQSSSQSLGALGLRTAQPCVNSRSTRGATSTLQLSPPRTPRSPDPNSRPHCDTSNSRTCQRTPTVVMRINSIFEARIGKKHLRRIYHYAESSSGRVTDDSTSESELEDRAKAHRQRLVSAKSILSRPSPSAASRAPVEHQRRLFEYFVVVSLQKSKSTGLYQPEVTQQFPPKLEQSFKVIRESENQLRSIPLFCFPDATDWEPVDHYLRHLTPPRLKPPLKYQGCVVTDRAAILLWTHHLQEDHEMFSFVLTGEDGSRRFGYCRRLLPTGKGKRLPEVYCIISHLGCFNLFSKVLDEVERRRALSPALVQPFMRAIMEVQCPAPGKSITIRTFLPGSGTEVMELSRPPDSRLEHVDFECLLSSLSLRLLLGVFSSLLLERRVIFTAHKLSTLSQCCHAALALLYPFVWQHTYIPVLPSNMLDIVCTPTPFFVGLLSSSLPQLRQLPLEEVLVVDLGGRRFLRQLDDEDSILPCKLQSALESVLERRRELASERGDVDVSTVVSEAFVRLLVELVGHYPLFVRGEREDGYSSSSSSSTPGPSSFQRDPFRKAVPSKSSRRFLEIFMETQMFSRFVQERELRRQAPRGLFEVRVHEYLLSIHDNDHRRVNRFLKGLGNKMKFLSKK